MESLTLFAGGQTALQADGMNHNLVAQNIKKKKKRLKYYIILYICQPSNFSCLYLQSRTKSAYRILLSIVASQKHDRL